MLNVLLLDILLAEIDQLQYATFLIGTYETFCVFTNDNKVNIRLVRWVGCDLRSRVKYGLGYMNRGTYRDNGSDVGVKVKDLS